MKKKLIGEKPLSMFMAKRQSRCNYENNSYNLEKLNICMTLDKIIINYNYLSVLVLKLNNRIRFYNILRI